jgi:opacity protein-like surface antigen
MLGGRERQSPQRPRVWGDLSQQDRVAGLGDRPRRLCLGSLPRLRQGRRRLGTRQLAATTLILGTAYRASDTRSGWTIGGGGEYAITKCLSGFVEYDYYDFGTNTTRLTPQVPDLRAGFVGIEERANVVRAGVNVRFGG